MVYWCFGCRRGERFVEGRKRQGQAFWFRSRLMKDSRSNCVHCNSTFDNVKACQMGYLSSNFPFQKTLETFLICLLGLHGSSLSMPASSSCQSRLHASYRLAPIPQSLESSPSQILALLKADILIIFELKSSTRLAHLLPLPIHAPNIASF